MSAIVRSWLRAFCPQCQQRRIFVLKDGWVLSCSGCQSEKHLAKNGLLAG